jgi:hypothetical protein
MNRIIAGLLLLAALVAAGCGSGSPTNPDPTPPPEPQPTQDKGGKPPPGANPA